jgi:hypothetical protein
MSMCSCCFANGFASIIQPPSGYLKPTWLFVNELNCGEYCKWIRVVVEGGHCCVRGQRRKYEGVGDEVDVHHSTCTEWCGVGVPLYLFGGRKVLASLGRV